MPEVLPKASCEEQTDAVIDEYWFDAALYNNRQKLEIVRRICARCDAFKWCLEFALDERPAFGVHAGLTPREIDRLATGGAA